MTHPVSRSAIAVFLAIACLAQAGCNQQPKAAERPGMLSPDDRMRRAEDLAGQGDTARLAGRSEQAISFYRESIEYSADYPDVWNNLGLLLLERNELDKALSAFTMAADLDPTDPRPRTNIGITNMRAGWAEYAISDFRQALEITPSYLPALRGAIRAADLLAKAEYEDLERIRRALLAERDEQWRAYFERQKYVIESRLRSDRETPGSASAGDRAP